MFNPNDVGLNNGNLFGFPFSVEEADLIVIPVQSDVTCSYAKGTAEGPERILEASTQLDFFSPYLEKAWEQKVAMLPLVKKDLVDNTKIGECASSIIDKLEEGLDLNQADLGQIENINQHGRRVLSSTKEEALKWLNQGKKVAVLGGDHSSPLGLIHALAEKYDSFGILQIDAHADLREAYEGFEFSHASIMFNALKENSVSKLVQVGIRDICPAEVELIAESKGRIKTYFDWQLKEEKANGITWKYQCQEIVNSLPDKVYISYDIDGLDPKLCPNTGTPVPGGFEFEEINLLIKELKEAGKEIIGFDLCEVGNNEWDANVGARVLYRLCNFI